jgi:hypothetical protein
MEWQESGAAPVRPPDFYLPMRGVGRRSGPGGSRPSLVIGQSLRFFKDA